MLRAGRFVLGDEVERFERDFAAWVGTSFAIGVASGTDALTIALQAVGVGPGDEVVTAASTCVPTVVGIEATGAKAVLADVDPATSTLDPGALEAAVTPRTRAVVPVHLYGQTADLGPIADIASRHGLELVEDCAQAHGAEYEGRRAGTFGRGAAFSFYPTKNLGALGDGGAVVTSDPEVAERAALLRNYGERERFRHVERGRNSRLDVLQAAVLSAKLPLVDAWTERRRELARVYDETLGAIGAPLAEAPRRRHVYHLYVLRCDERDRFRTTLERAGVGTAVHYPLPIHLQPAYADLGRPGAFPAAEQLARSVVSLPLYPELTDAEADHVARVARAALEARYEPNAP